MKLTASSILSIFLSLFLPAITIAAPANHLVISEIQISSENDADEEFVELYNPTSNPISIDGWKLKRKTSGGTESNIVSSFPDNTTIQPGNFLLISHPDFISNLNADIGYTATSSAITANNTIILYNNAPTPTIIDKVGMGTATDKENLATLVPDAGQSIERKALSTSTSDSMLTTDLNLGNGEDTDNNLNDFVLKIAPQPQNSSSPSESITNITPSPTPTNTPLVTPTPTTPIPTPTNTTTPEPTPTISPTSQPTPTITATPTTQITPTPTTTPTATPTPTPNTSKLLVAFPSGKKCYLTSRPLVIFGVTFSMPRMQCNK